MLKLIVPSEEYLKSYTQAYDEYKAAGVNTYGMSDPRASDILQKHENYRLGRNLKPDRVPSDCYWLVDEERNYFIGEIHIRHRLNVALSLCGGHIGYVIRCSEWGKGYGTKGLALTLEIARNIVPEEEIYLRVLKSNLPSFKVMRNNGAYIAGEDDTHYLMRIKK